MKNYNDQMKFGYVNLTILKNNHVFDVHLWGYDFVILGTNDYYETINWKYFEALYNCKIKCHI